MTLVAESPVLDSDHFRAVMAEFPTVLTVVTALGPHGPIGCTANAVMSLSLRPPSVAVSLATDGRTARDALRPAPLRPPQPTTETSATNSRRS